MKQFIMYIVRILLVPVVIIPVSFLSIVAIPKDMLYTSYNGAIQTKFHYMMETDDPKIIFVAGSSGAFGLNEKMLSEATGYKVVNLGLHAGFAPVFYTELSKANINSGDIVILAYELNWYQTGAFERIGTDLVMNGIDGDISMYRYIPLKFWPSIIGYLPTFAYKKLHFTPPSGCYARSSFDETTGYMTYPRKEWFFNQYRGNEDIHGRIDVSDPVIGDDSVKYLRAYKKFIESKGASVYFTSSTHLREAFISDPNNLQVLKQKEEAQIGIPYISDPEKALYPEVLMYFDVNHCNNRGADYRTKRLINDLNDVGAINIKDIEKYNIEKDDQIIFENDISKYLKEINDPDYVVFISAKDDCSAGLTDEIQKGLFNLGITIDLRDKYRNSFCAVIDGGKLISENISAYSKVSAEGTLGETITYSISSAGYDCGNDSSIKVSGLEINGEYTRNDRGLNIVVFRKSTGVMVDVVSFDTHSDSAAGR